MLGKETSIWEEKLRESGAKAALTHEWKRQSGCRWWQRTHKATMLNTSLHISALICKSWQIKHESACQRACTLALWACTLTHKTHTPNIPGWSLPAEHYRCPRAEIASGGSSAHVHGCVSPSRLRLLFFSLWWSCRLRRMMAVFLREA